MHKRQFRLGPAMLGSLRPISDELRPAPNASFPANSIFNTVAAIGRQSVVFFSCDFFVNKEVSEVYKRSSQLCSRVGSLHTYLLEVLSNCITLKSDTTVPQEMVSILQLPTSTFSKTHTNMECNKCHQNAYIS